MIYIYDEHINIYIHIYICIGRGLALYRQHTHSAFSLFRSRLYNAATLKLASMGCYGPIPERPTCVLHTCICDVSACMCCVCCVAVCAVCAVCVCCVCMHVSICPISEHAARSRVEAFLQPSSTLKADP